MIKFLNSTEYSKIKLSFYDNIIKSGDGLSDLEMVKVVGVNTELANDYLLWKAYEKWVIEGPKKGKSIRDIERMCNIINNNLLFKKEIDQTTLIHHNNKFMCLGVLRRERHLIRRKKGDYNQTPWIFHIEKEILNRGLDWVRIDNFYFRGNFQRERGLGLIQ